MKNNKSFTIVELLVVMAVIGILLSLAVFGIQVLQKSERETQRVNDLRNIQGQLEAFYSKFKRYPRMADQTDSEVYVVGKEFLITSTAGPTGTEFVRIPILQLTPQFNDGYAAAGGTFRYPDPYMNCIGGNMATPEFWKIYIKTGRAGTYPQQYALWACTENGKTINYGGRND